MYVSQAWIPRPRATTRRESRPQVSLAMPARTYRDKGRLRVRFIVLQTNPMTFSQRRLIANDRDRPEPISEWRRHRGIATARLCANRFAIHVRRPGTTSGG